MMIFTIFLLFLLVFSGCKTVDEKTKAKELAIKEIKKSNEYIESQGKNIEMLNYSKQDCNGCHIVKIKYSNSNNEEKIYVVQIRNWVVYHINEELTAPNI